jgi:hypothetical protein
MQTNEQQQECSGSGNGEANCSAVASGEVGNGSVDPVLSRSVPTRTQVKVLEWEADGRAELMLQTGLSGAALEASVRACQRRGWLDADGLRTVAGDDALTRGYNRVNLGSAK